MKVGSGHGFSGRNFTIGPRSLTSGIRNFTLRSLPKKRKIISLIYLFSESIIAVSAEATVFYIIREINEVTKGVAKPYESQIKKAGPLTAVMRLQCYLHKEASPPSPSPVSAHLVNMSLGTWANAESYLESVRRQLHPAMEEFFHHWKMMTAELCQDRHHLLALAVPLLIESQMNAFSGRARQVTLDLLAPILQSSAPLYGENAVSPVQQANAEIIVTMHAGRTYYALVSHPESVLREWGAWLEAATILLLPQVVVRAESTLTEKDRDFMINAIRSEIEAWSKTPSAIGHTVSWRGRPYFTWMNPTEAEVVEKELQKVLAVLPIYSASGRNLKPYIEEARRLIERLKGLGFDSGAISVYERQIEKYQR